MKFFIALACSLAFAAPLAAQTAAAAPAATATTPPTAPTSGKFTLDMSIEALMADPAAKAVIEASFPGMSAHPAFDQFKSMSIKTLQPMSGGAITDESIAKATVALAAIK